MFAPQISALATRTINGLTETGKHIVTAESCTGGLIAGALTSIAGSSAAVYGGFVTYDNLAKIKMIGVPEAILEAHGAVSEQTARAMAQGAREVSEVDISIAVTGIAGPGGGTEEKPVGLVYLSCATARETYHLEMRYGELGREDIRAATVVSALRMVLDVLRSD